jgi:Family of unknown function (DUF6496)
MKFARDISLNTLEINMSMYSDTAQAKVKKVMEERKAGTLRSGSTGEKVTSRKQAIAIGLSEGRRSDQRRNFPAAYPNASAPGT